MYFQKELQGRCFLWRRQQEHLNPERKKGAYRPDAGLNATFVTLKAFLLLPPAFSEVFEKGTCCRAGSMSDQASPQGWWHQHCCYPRGSRALLSCSGALVKSLSSSQAALGPGQGILHGLMLAAFSSRQSFPELLDSGHFQQLADIAMLPQC